MNKYKKMYKGLSLSELQKVLDDLKAEEIELKKKKADRMLDGAIEDYVGDKRFIKDMGWVALGIGSFQASQVFLCQPIKDAPAANFIFAGLCAVGAALTILATRKGFDNDKKRLYEERKKYLLEHPEEVDKFEKNAPRYDECLYLDINFEKQCAVSELILDQIYKNDPVFPEYTR